MAPCGGAPVSLDGALGVAADCETAESGGGDAVDEFVEAHASSRRPRADFGTDIVDYPDINHASTRHAEAAACRDGQGEGSSSYASAAGTHQLHGETPMAGGHAGLRLRSSAAETAGSMVDKEPVREQCALGLAGTHGRTMGERRSLVPTPLTLILLVANLVVLNLLLQKLL